MGKTTGTETGSFSNDVAAGLGSQNYYDPDRALFERDLAYEMYGPGAATGSMAAGTGYGTPQNPYNPGPASALTGTPGGVTPPAGTVPNGDGTFAQIGGGSPTTRGGSTTVVGGRPGPAPPVEQSPPGTLPGDPTTGGDPTMGGSSKYQMTGAPSRSVVPVDPYGDPSGGGGGGVTTAPPPGAMPPRPQPILPTPPGGPPGTTVVPFRDPTYDDITNPLGGGAPGGGGPGGGVAGQRDAAGGLTLSGLQAMLQNPEIAQSVKNAIQQQGALTTQAGYAGAGEGIVRNAAATGNTAGTAAALAQLGRNQSGALGDLARQNQIAFENEAQRRRETALSGLSNYYGQTSSNFNTLAGLRGALVGSPVGSGTNTRTLSRGVKTGDTTGTNIQWV